MKRFLLFSLLIITALTYSQITIAQNGNCNEADLDYLSENMEFVQNLVATCGSDCALTPDPEGCLQECLETQTPLSTECIQCFNEQMTCALDNCFFPCGFGTEEQCADCIEENCIDQFFVCAGITDEDNDGFTNLEDCNDMNSSINPEAEEIWYDGVDQNCDGQSDFDQDGDGEDSAEFGGMDCNDQDPQITGGAFVVYPDMDGDGYGNDEGEMTVCILPPDVVETGGDCDDTNEEIYPGAPGTGEGLDNNCNGFLEPDELVAGECVQDLDNNGVVTSADLLILLSDFGCVGSDCLADLDNDQAVTSSDLLLFLPIFGSPCVD